MVNDSIKRGRRLIAPTNLLAMIIIMAFGFFTGCDTNPDPDPEPDPFAVAITSPEAEAFVSGSFTMTGSLTVPSGMTPSRVNILEEESGDTWIVLLTRSGDSYSWEADISLGEHTTSGLVTFRVQGRATSGELTEAVRINYMVDAAAPVISNFRLADYTSENPLLSPSVSLNVSGTASDNNSVAAISYGFISSVTEDPSSWTTIDAPGSGESWSFSEALSLSTLTDGSYYVVFRAQDGAGNYSDRYTLPFSIDASVPVVTVATPTEGLVISATSLTVSGTATEDSELSSISIRLDSGGFQTISSDNITETSSGEYAWEYALSNLSPGSHTITVKAEDGGGNVSAELSRSFTVDNPFDLEISSPTDNTVFQTSAIEISGTVTAGLYPTSSVKVALNGETQGTAQSVIGNFEAWSFNLSGVSEGIHTVSAWALDTQGNLTEVAEITIYLDTTPPLTPVIQSPANLAMVFDNNLDVEVSAQDTTGGSGIRYVQVQLDGGGWNSASFQSSTQVWVYTLSALTDGEHTIQVRSIDKAEKTSPLAERTFTKDQRPILSLTSHVAGESYYRNTSPLTISGTASDNSSLDAVKVQVNGGAWQTVTGTGSWSVDLALGSSGTKEITLQAVDNNGNTSLPQSFTVYYDTSAPAAPVITSPAEGFRFTASSLAVSGTASDNVSLDKVEVKVDTGAWEMATGTTNFSKTISSLALGSHTIYVRAIDKAGNVSSESTVTIIQDAVPVVAITSPAADHYFSTSSVSFSGTATDNSAVSQVYGRIDGGSWGILSYSGDTWSYPKALSDGQHVVSVYAKDEYGFESSIQSLTFNVDTVAPTLNVVAPLEGQELFDITSLTASGTASDFSLESVSLELDTSGSWLPATGTSSWSRTFSGLTEGNHILKIKAVDAVGQETIVSRNFSVIASTELTVGVAYLDGSITDAGQVVWYRFPATSGQNYTVAWEDYNSNTSLVNVRISVYEPDRSTIKLYNQETTPRSFTADSTGDHYIKVEQSSTPTTGTFRIRVYQ